MQIGNYFLRIQLSIWTKKTIKINQNLKKKTQNGLGYKLSSIIYNILIGDKES